MYDCKWGTDIIRVVVAGDLPREAHNAPLHLFSASPELVGFGRGAYRRRSERTSLLLGQLFERFRAEGLAMTYTRHARTRRGPGASEGRASCAKRRSPTWTAGVTPTNCPPTV